MPTSPDVVCLFDDRTNSATYVVSDPETAKAVVIDPVLDFDPIAGKTWTESAQRVVDHVRENGLAVDWLLETHVHADHLSAAQWLSGELGGARAIGAGVTQVQKTFGELFNAREMTPDGSQFDRLFGEGDTFAIGNIEARVIATPGHTPACVTYVIGDACFVGDTMFMPDSGTARCDFPGGDARQLYASLTKILALPGDMRLFVCHDYGAGGTRDFEWETTVATQRADNIHVGGGALEHDYVQMRTDRDATLSLPRLIIPAVQINMRAGAFPPAEENGTSYLKVPLNVF
ncbi:MAG: MBL fold metallo-hydrolase [Alphaproteobacteria bacterium]|jgi:glyoxylase-like metal-dependent hydrolase (beta-lactamase superfamily II)